MPPQRGGVNNYNQLVFHNATSLAAVVEYAFLRIGTLPPSPSLKVKRGGDRSLTSSWG